MAASYLDADEPEETWLILREDKPVGLAYVAPERMTAGTWNLFLIANQADRHDRGHGTLLMDHVECAVAARGGRVHLVETSGLPAFERKRTFDERRGYDREVRIRDVYDDGNDKVVFWKALQAMRDSEV